MKRVVSVSLGSSQRDYSFTTTVLGRRIEVRRIGANGDVALAAELIREHDGRVDAIGLGGLTPVFRVGEARGRLAADYRFRVAGDAEPRSGPALTVSAGF